jgi:hypothetical protein
VSLKDLAYRIAHNYPGGVKPLAARMSDANGYHQVLLNKLNPNTTTHHVTVSELEQIADIADANLPLAEYFATKINAVVIRILECNGSDIEILDAFMDVIKELGSFSAEFQRDWADGRITPQEFRRLTKEAARLQATVLSFMARVEQLVEFPSTHLHSIK